MLRADGAIPTPRESIGAKGPFVCREFLTSCVGKSPTDCSAMQVSMWSATAALERAELKRKPRMSQSDILGP